MFPGQFTEIRTKNTKNHENTKKYEIKQAYTVHGCVTETHTKGYETYHMQRAITYAHVSTKYEQSKKNAQQQRMKYVTDK